MKGQWCWKSCLQGCGVGTALHPTVPRQILEPGQSPGGTVLPGCCLPPRSGQWPTENTVKEADSSSPHLIIQKHPRKRALLSGNWNHCPCILVLTWLKKILKMCRHKRTVYIMDINSMHISIHSMHLSASHKDCCSSFFSSPFSILPVVAIVVISVTNRSLRLQWAPWL